MDTTTLQASTLLSVGVLWLGAAVLTAGLLAGLRAA